MQYADVIMHAMRILARARLTHPDFNYFFFIFEFEQSTARTDRDLIDTIVFCSLSFVFRKPAAAEDTYWLRCEGEGVYRMAPGNRIPFRLVKTGGKMRKGFSTSKQGPEAWGGSVGK